MNKKTVITLLISLSLLPSLRQIPQNNQRENLQQSEGFHADRGKEIMAAAPDNAGSGNILPDSRFSYYAYQWSLKNNGQVSGRSANGNRVVEGIPGIDINIESAWDIYMQSAFRRPVTVAVIDTGIDIMHAELQNAVWINADEIPGDGIDNDQNGYIDDMNGWNFYSDNPYVSEGRESHGTHAAGIIAARWNGQGVTGIADSEYVKIMPLKVLDSAEGLGVSTSVKTAIRYAEANGADICNLSLGTFSYDEELETLMRNSRMLFVVSAGNGDESDQGYDIDSSPVYPASFSSDNIISVANLMFDGTLAANSNYGAISVDIAAPGTYILSTVSNNEYGFMSGTSMAAPMVTGTAALIYSCRLDLSLLDIKHLMTDSARKVDALSGKVASGGILDAYGAITSDL